MRHFFIMLGLLCGLVAQSVYATETTNTKKQDITILALGDSLTAGYGLPQKESFTVQLQEWLQAEMGCAQNIKVINGGVSGDTSSGGAARLAWTLGNSKPDLVILEFGGNDGLRAIDPSYTRQNMDSMVKFLKDKGLSVLVAGMQAPPNLGPDYAESFNSIFSDIAAKYDVALYPFFLEGVAMNPALNQADAIHPNKEGVAIIVSKIGPVIRDLIIQ